MDAIEDFAVIGALEAIREEFPLVQDKCVLFPEYIRALRVDLLASSKDGYGDGIFSDSLGGGLIFEEREAASFFECGRVDSNISGG